MVVISERRKKNIHTHSKSGQTVCLQENAHLTKSDNRDYSAKRKMLPSQIRALLAAAALGAASAYSPAPTASPCATLPRRAAVDRRAIFMEMEVRHASN
jgi:uncharacterized protein with LGFP repeats